MRRFLKVCLATVVGLSAATSSNAAEKAKPIKSLIITGDNVGAHDWKGTTQALSDILAVQGLCNVESTSSPSKDLTDENLAKYDVLILNYKDTPQGSPESHWSDANKEAFLKAVKSGKGLVVRTTPRRPSRSRTGPSSKKRSPAAGVRKATTGRSMSSSSRKPM